MSEWILVMAQHVQLDLSLSVEKKSLRRSSTEVNGLLDQYRMESGCDIVGKRASASDIRRGRNKRRFCLIWVFGSVIVPVK